jgi:hypothetical protein
MPINLEVRVLVHLRSPQHLLDRHGSNGSVPLLHDAVRTYSSSSHNFDKRNIAPAIDAAVASDSAALTFLPPPGDSCEP